MSDTVEVPTDGGDGVFWDEAISSEIIDTPYRLVSLRNIKLKKINNIFTNNNNYNNNIS
jgi:hypothetical protein